MDEVFINGGAASARLYLEAANPTQQDVLDSNGGRNPRMMLPNGRRTTAVVIKPASDAWVNEGGDLVPAYDDEPLPGVAHMIVTDATGAIRNHGRDDVTNTQTPGLYLVSDNPEDGAYIYDMVSIHHGPGGGPSGGTPSSISALTRGAGSGTGTDSVNQATFNSDIGDCACRNNDPTEALFSITGIDTNIGHIHDYNGGNVVDWPMGIQFSGGYSPIGTSGVTGGGIQVFGDTDGDGNRVFRRNGGTGSVIRNPDGGIKTERHTDQPVCHGPAEYADPNQSSSDKAARVGELILYLGLDAAGIATAIGMMSAPTGLTQILGAVMIVGAVFQLTAHLDELYEILSGDPGLMDQDTRDAMETIGAVLELAAGITHIVKEIAPSVPRYFDDIAKKVDDILKSGKDDVVDTATDAGKTNPGEVIRKNYEVGKAAERDLIEELGGKAAGVDDQAYFMTCHGGRYVDALADGVAHEVKTGYVTGTESILKQIKKDKALLDAELVSEVIWHFRKNADGTARASKTVLDELDANGIKYVFD